MAELMSTPKQKGELYLASSLCDGLEDNDLRQVATLLRSKEADPNVLMPLHGVTPFHLVIGNHSEAFAEEVTKLFLRHGGNPNVKSVDGMTPVHIAAAWGRTKILELLLANGGDPLCDDNDNCTPFNYAFQGDHYEAVSVLSKFCVDSKDDDDSPKFKRELGKVIINNGEMLAEYILSDESCSSSKNIFQKSNQNKENNSSGYEPEGGSTEPNLNESFSKRKKLKKKVINTMIDHIPNKENKDGFDFTRETEEEEMNLINEIISRMSSSVVSNAETSTQNCDNECAIHNETNSSKRLQMTMTFHRPEKCCKSAKEKLNSTLKVIKKNTGILCFKNNNILASNFQKSSTISDKNLVSKKFVYSKKNVIQNKLKEKTPVRAYNSKWLDETIISKSPNLIIESHPKEKRKIFLQNSMPERKETVDTFSKLCDEVPSNISVRKYDKLSNSKTPISRIPISKKCFTSGYSKPMKKITETPKTVPNTQRFNSFKRSEKISCLNQTFDKATVSPSSNSRAEKKSCNKTNQSIKNIAINLYSCTYEQDVKEETLKILTNLESDKNIVQKNKTLEKPLTKLNTSSNIISGIEVLDSEASLNCTSENISTQTESDVIFHETSVDLNEAMTDYFSSAESKKEQFCDIENSKNFDDSHSITSCVMCEKNFPPEVNTSFLSLTSLNDTYNLEKNGNLNKKLSISSTSNSIISKDDSSCKKFGYERFLSMQEEYKYKDFEEGVKFVERRLCVSPSCASSEMNTSYYSCSTSKSEPLPKELYLLDNITLRKKLKTLGENPGPITTSTHHLYLKRLHKLQSQKKKIIPPKLASDNKSNFSYNLDVEKELLKPPLLSLKWIQNLNDFELTEQKIFQEFTTPHPSRKWREGTSKCSFNYLLLDPRITEDLPRRAANLSLPEKWQIFLSAIFYVGKGKQSRPYAHLYDAFKIWISNRPNEDQNFNSDKIQRILDIWNGDQGVIVLHVFHNTIPVEAYTREAAMIDALGTRKLGNCKAGNYYGIVSTWKPREKCELGRYFLYKAFQMLLLEGERQIFPDNL